MVGGVDIGGTKIAVGVVDSEGRILAKNECPTNESRGCDHAMRQVASLLRECADSAHVQIDGIGIGSAGPVNAATGVFGNINNLPSWAGGNPVEFFSKEFGVPAALENDADAAALGELYWGAGKSRMRFLYVTVGTGIGVSVILDGKVYRGVDGCHPELGHHIIDPAGPSCTCGVRGCWESLAAGPAMSRWLRDNAPADSANRNRNAREIFSNAQHSDEWAARAVEREAYYLGLGVANLITIFAPETIVMGGGVMKSAPLFFERMREVVRQNCKLVPADRVEIALASLGENVGLIGAAQVWHHRFERCG